MRQARQQALGKLQVGGNATAIAYAHLRFDKAPMPPVASFDELNTALGFEEIWALDEKLSSS